VSCWAATPGPITRSSSSLGTEPQLAPEIPAGLPSVLLQHRPDVAASEQLLIAANANIGASFAKLFPAHWPHYVPPRGNVGATLAGPIFQGGQNPRPVESGEGKLRRSESRL